MSPRERGREQIRPPENLCLLGLREEMQTHHISIDPYSRAPLMVAMTAMTISSAPDTTKLSKELVERAAAGRHQDVDRLLKDGADTWIREPVHVQCQTRMALYGIVWHCVALYGSWSMILFGG